MASFEFPAHDRFLDRQADLARLENWWAGAERNALALFGRRRVGKSWLFREFADGKPALLLVALAEVVEWTGVDGVFEVIDEVRWGV